MNVLEIKQKIRQFDNKTTFVKLLAIATLFTAIIFPINLWLNPNVDPIVFTHPIFLGFGFVALVVAVMMVIVSGIILTLLVLDGYLTLSPRFLDSLGKINAFTLSRDESFLDRLSYGIHTRTLALSKNHNDPKVEELEQGSIRQQKEIDELKQENESLKSLILPHIARQNRSNFDFNYRLKKVEFEKSEKIQTIGDKAQSNINGENTDLKKFKEDL